MSGVEIEQVTLTDGPMRVSLLSLGATTQGWWVNEVPLILGYEDPGAYTQNSGYLGVIAGRVANRIGGATFELDGVRYVLDANEGQNTLHGGAQSMVRQNWQIEQRSQTEAILHLFSNDGDCGFPGQVRFTLQVTLQAPRLIYTFLAEVDRPTPISLAQHNYYTLGETDGIAGLSLRLPGDHLLEKDAEGVPTGEILPATGPYDFRDFRPLHTAPDLDHFYPFRPSVAGALRDIAELRAASGLGLRVMSDQPGAQVYAGGGLGAPFAPGAGVCIEPSGFPNAVNVGHFPSMIVTPDHPYCQRLVLDLTGAGI
ncbi:galactose mutarotase [Epibacterium sp. SM1979]|uniref:Galactose mutarotase n=1 Tax=Tritonibacter litoralis TaxID=2662264 RepID=A0A843YLV9_9RHOB|nr:aldose epimerase family protein [Tritonibacter litoralis]MQQ10169.1 galactose mutarotase [Tritonibacter litoralis]